MKRLLYLLVIAIALPSLLLTSCKDDSDDVINEFDVLKEYLVAQGMDLDHVIKNADGQKFVFGAPTTGDLSAKHIIDIRSAADFANGHIKDAVNTPFADILTEAAKATKPIAVVCYTGQTACYATALLRLYGYKDAQALKWGMSSWHQDFAGKWDANKGNLSASNTDNWTQTATEAPATFATPVISTGATTGETILKARIEDVIAKGFKNVSADDVIGTPGNYYINNYFSETDYSAFGHIKGAYRLQPFTLGGGQHLNLDPSKKVVTYCYTGQTSAVITAFLNVMGYDSYSLLFGMNKLSNSSTGWNTDANKINQWGGANNPFPYSLAYVK